MHVEQLTVAQYDLRPARIVSVSNAYMQPA
jgi:hypothetical protein